MGKNIVIFRKPVERYYITKSNLPRIAIFKFQISQYYDLLRSNILTLGHRYCQIIRYPGILVHEYLLFKKTLSISSRTSLL